MIVTMANSKKRPLQFSEPMGSAGSIQAKTLPPQKRMKTESIVGNIEINPSDYVRCAFKANGFAVDEVQSKTGAVFIEPTKEMIDAYQPELLNCVRRRDIEGLKKLHEVGRLINCCNKFGESLLHLACRRGFTNIVKYLIEVVKVNLNIRDDYLRTPLHDACWTSEPNYELVDMLMRIAPELLVMEDARGFTPFDYVRKEHRGKWLRFLWERRAILQPLKAGEEEEDDMNKLKCVPPAIAVESKT
jgi:hypothetical protein